MGGMGKRQNCQEAGCCARNLPVDSGELYQIQAAKPQEAEEKKKRKRKAKPTRIRETECQKDK
jgi:hypothetical protein